MLGRWDEQKGLKQQFQAPLKDFVVQKLAFQMHRRKRTSMPIEEASQIIRRELSSRGYEADVAQLTSEIVSRSGLFRALDGVIEFRHQLVQEFFAGRAIDSLGFVESVVSDEWWRRALVFYFGDNPEQVGRLKAVSDVVAKLEPHEIFEAAETIGLALQACYLAQLNPKMELWKWVVDALCVSEDAAIRAADPKNERPWITFVGLHISARDSVALSNLANQIPGLATWLKDESPNNGVSAEKRMYWTILGLIESGDIENAAALCHDFKPTDPRYLLGIHLGAMLAHIVRPITTEKRVAAKGICEQIAPRVEHLRRQMLTELKSELLELKRGAIEIVEEEPQV
jgi:hypothetical protein